MVNTIERYDGDGKEEEGRTYKSKPIPPPIQVTDSPKRPMKRSINENTERVLDSVNFGKQFEKLPKFKPLNTESGANLPRSPRLLANSLRKKSKPSLGML